MPNGYSNDLRNRVLSYYDDNHSQEETIERFSISCSSLKRWLKMRRETGSYLLKARPAKRKRKLDGEEIKAYLEKHPDAYLREIATIFEVSVSAVWYACQRHKLTRKKR